MVMLRRPFLLLGLLHLVTAAVLLPIRAADAVLLFSVGVDSGAVHALLNVLFWQPLTLHVSLDPEVGEEHEEEGAVHPDEVEDHGELVVTAVHEVILGSVERHQDKLGLWEEITSQPNIHFRTMLSHLSRCLWSRDFHLAGIEKTILKTNLFKLHHPYPRSLQVNVK